MTPTNGFGHELFKKAERERHDLVLFSFVAFFGAAASYSTVNIPHTEVFIEIRYAFGFLGFALLRRREYAILLACLLSVTGPHKLPLGLVFAANMFFAVPGLIT